MNYSEIISAISSVGFPIVACVVLFKQNGKLSETLAELSATLTGINQRLDNIENKVLEDNK